jgi:hypothetical protein
VGDILPLDLRHIRLVTRLLSDNRGKGVEKDRFLSMILSAGYVIEDKNLLFFIVYHPADISSPLGMCWVRILGSMALYFQCFPNAFVGWHYHIES